MDPTLIGVLASSIVGPAVLWLVRRHDNSRKALDKAIRATFEQVMAMSGSTDREVNRKLFLDLLVSGWALSGGRASEAVKLRAGAMFDGLWRLATVQAETRAREALIGAGKRAEAFSRHLEELAKKDAAAVGPDGRVHL